MHVGGAKAWCIVGAVVGPTSSSSCLYNLCSKLSHTIHGSPGLSTALSVPAPFPCSTLTKARSAAVVTFIRCTQCTAGKVQYNKEAASTRIYRNLVRHVPQDDALEPGLTVAQNMQLAAHLSLPPHFTSHRRSTLVQEVLDLLALTPLQHCLVGTPGAAGQQGEPLSDN